MEISISWKCMSYLVFGRYGSRSGPLSSSFYSPLFLLPIMWPWHLSHVITTAMPFCSYSRIPWSLLAGSSTCVDVVKFFFEFKLQNKRNVYYDCYILCIHNRRELRKTISEKTLIFEIKQPQNSQITQSHRNSRDIEFEFT